MLRVKMSNSRTEALRDSREIENLKVRVETARQLSILMDQQVEALKYDVSHIENAFDRVIEKVAELYGKEHIEELTSFKYQDEELVKTYSVSIDNQK